MNKIIHVSEMDQYPDAVYIGRAIPRYRLKASREEADHADR